jgi:hypothetical protein
MMKRAMTFLMLSGALVACGGIAADDIVTTDSGSDAGIDGHPPDAKPLSPFCPATIPPQGSACALKNSTIMCEYGDDPRWTCNTMAYCNNGTWLYSQTDSAWCPTPATNPAACPATFAAAQQGGVCTATAPCHYAEGWCACMNLGGPPIPDAGPPSSSWVCSFALAPGCPAVRPHLGATCTQPNLECDYSACDDPDGLSVQCDPTTMVWMHGFGAPCAGAQ